MLLVADHRLEQAADRAERGRVVRVGALLPAARVVLAQRALDAVVNAASVDDAIALGGRDEPPPAALVVGVFALANGL